MFSSDQGLFHYDVVSGHRIRLSGDALGCYRLAWHTKLPLVAAFNKDQLFVADLSEQNVVTSDLEYEMHSLAWHPEKAELVLGPDDYRRELTELGNRWIHNGIYSWSRENAKCQYIEIDDAELRERVTVFFDATGDHVIAGSNYAQLVVFDWNQRGQGYELAGRNCPAPQHTNRINRFLWHPDDQNRLFSASIDSTICEWDLANKRIVQRYRFHRNGVTGLKSSNDGSQVCSVDASGNLYVWDINNPTERGYCHIPWPIKDISWDTSDQYVLVCHALGITKVDLSTMTAGISILFQEDGGEVVLEPGYELEEQTPTDSPYRLRKSGLLLATSNGSK